MSQEIPKSWVGRILDFFARLLPQPGPPVLDSSVQAKIETPLDGGEVGYRISVEGTHRRVPDNMELWLVLYSPDEDLFYPQPSAIMLLPGGRWYTMATIGEDKSQYIGKTYEMLLLMLPRASAMQLVRQAHEAMARGKGLGTPNIPRNGMVMDRRVITRR